MADLSNEPILWDVRILERRLRRGEVSDKQLQAYLQTLPDVADKATASIPLEEPIERPPPRRPQVRRSLRRLLCVAIWMIRMSWTPI